MTAVPLDALVPVFAGPALGYFAGRIRDVAPRIKGRACKGRT
jgi:hypothetical protein